MIFWKLFYTFCKIGILNFGGGYSMIALIQHEVVEKNGWLTAQEFTDVVATSQMTPGPIGINVATYSGYTAVVHAGYAEWAAIMGALLASFAVILLPFLLMVLISRFLWKHKDNKRVSQIFYYLRLTVIGLIAAAALLLMTPENFGTPSTNLLHFITNILIFSLVLFFSLRYKTNPILLILISGLFGSIFYHFF